MCNYFPDEMENSLRIDLTNITDVQLINCILLCPELNDITVLSPYFGRKIGINFQCGNWELLAGCIHAESDIKPFFKERYVTIHNFVYLGTSLGF